MNRWVFQLCWLAFLLLGVDAKRGEGRIPRMVGRKYEVGRLLGTGAFGKIYEGTNLENGRSVALKFEDYEEDDTLDREYKIYKMLTRNTTAHVGIPKVRWYGREGRYNVLVVDLLGESVEGLFDYCGRKFTLKTVLMIVDQMLERIEYLHSRSVLHRDIKLENFLLGRKEESHMIYLIDFGLSKPYRDMDTMEHVPFRVNKSLTGTPRYSSLGVQLGMEHARRDDLESIGYAFMYLLRGSLPWQGLGSDRLGAPYFELPTVDPITRKIVYRQPVPPEFPGRPNPESRGTSGSNAPVQVSVEGQGAGAAALNLDQMGSATISTPPSPPHTTTTTTAATPGGGGGGIEGAAVGEADDNEAAGEGANHDGDRPQQPHAPGAEAGGRAGTVLEGVQLPPEVKIPEPPSSGADEWRPKYAKILSKKLQIPLSQLCAGYPAEFLRYLEYTRSLDYEDTPDYAMLRKMFRDLFEGQNYVFDYRYDWVLLREEKRERRRLKKEREKQKLAGTEENANDAEETNGFAVVHDDGHVQVRAATSSEPSPSPPAPPTPTTPQKRILTGTREERAAQMKRQIEEEFMAAQQQPKKAARKQPSHHPLRDEDDESEEDPRPARLLVKEERRDPREREGHSVTSTSSGGVHPEPGAGHNDQQ